MLAGIAMLLISCFAFATLALHFLRTDYNPLQRFIRDAIGPYSIVMHIAFFCLSTGSFALVIALYLGISKSAHSYIVLILLFLWCICVFIASIYPTDLTGAAEIPSGKIHNNASSAGFLAVVLAYFSLLRFRKDEKGNQFYGYSLLLSVCLLLFFLP